MEILKKLKITNDKAIELLLDAKSMRDRDDVDYDLAEVEQEAIREN